MVIFDIAGGVGGGGWGGHYVDVPLLAPCQSVAGICGMYFAPLVYVSVCMYNIKVHYKNLQLCSTARKTS